MPGWFWKGLFAVNGVALLMFLALLFVAVPAADDYGYALKGVLYTPAEAVAYEYTHWAARYFQVLLTSVWFGWLMPVTTGYWTGLLLYLLILFLSLFALTRAAQLVVPTPVPALAVSFLLLTGILRGAPTLDETLYWHIGAATYLFSTSLFLLLLAVCLRYFAQPRWWHYPAMGGLALTAGGTLEIYAPLTFLALAFFVVAALLCKRGKGLYLFGLALSLAPIVVVLLCPGRAVREVYYPQHGQPLHSLFYGTLMTLRYIGQTLIDPYIWGTCLLLLPAALQAYRTLRRRLCLRLTAPLYTVCYLGGLCSIVVFHYYATGQQPVARLLSAWYVLFVLGLLPLLVIASPFLCRTAHKLGRRSGKAAVLARRVAVPLCLLYLASFLFINNPIKAGIDLTCHTGPFLREYRQMQEEIARQQSASTPEERQKQDLVLHNFAVRPLLLKTPDVADYGIGGYYGFRGAVFLAPAVVAPGK